MKKLVSIALGLLVSAAAWADPSPFGLEIGKATITQMQSKYKAEFNGYNHYSNGKMFKLETGQLGLNGLTDALAIFDTSEKLVAVLLTLPKHRFDAMFSSLNSKYVLQSKQIPFVGNKKAVWKDGKTEVTLDAPHMSFDMSLNYINQAFYKRYLNQSSKEREQAKQKESSQL